MYAWDEIKEFRDKGVVKGEWPTIPELFDMAYIRYPERPCFTVFEPDRKDLSYKAAYEKIMKGASYLVSKGIKAGDRVLLNGKNSPDWAIGYFAILAAGGVVVPIDNQMHVDRCMRLSEYAKARFAICDFDVLEKMKGIGGTWYDSLLGKAMLKGKSDDYDKIAEVECPMLENHVERSEFDDAAILFTSGTTGIPKGVMLTNDNLVSDCFETQANLDVTGTIYAILPLHHAYTMEAVVYISISIGNTVVFGRKLAMSRIFKEIREGEVTIFMAVPMLYNKMISSLMAGVKKKGMLVYLGVRGLMLFSGFWQSLTGKNIGKKLFHSLLEKVSFENIRVCISGGGPLPESTFRMFNQLGVNFVQGYGLTEASPITHVNPVEAFRPASVGKRFPDVEVKIVNPDSDGNGIIYIKGPMVMKGYYKNPEATSEVLTDDGWLNTGDVGYQDKDGYLYLTGRAKSVIVTEGGKNVFPEEIEDQFQLFNELEQVCVIGYMADKALRKEGIRIILVPSKEYMDSVGNDKAVVERHLNEIVDGVNRGLQNYKRITKVDVYYSPLPMTSTKKVKRNEVAKLFENV